MSEENFTFLDFAAEVLKHAETPMSVKEIWHSSSEFARRLLNTKGLTPWSTLGVELNKDIERGNSRFDRDNSVKPYRYFLKAKVGNPSFHIPRVDSGNDEPRREPRERARNERETDKRESLLHPLVCHFLRKNPVFAGGKKVISKTIDHTKSRSARSRAPDQWAHPDMVGFHMPFGQNRAHENWKDSVAQLNQITDNNALKLYSFELKRKIDRGTYRRK